MQVVLGIRSGERDTKEMVFRMQAAGIVTIDERLVVDVVYDQIERAVAIQVRVCGAAREARRRQAPLGRLVGKVKTAEVVERIVRQGRRGHRARELQEVRALAPIVRHRSHRLPVRDERDVVLRRNVFRDAGRYEDVLVAIEIEISDQCAPAPVRARNSGDLTDVAERVVMIVSLEHVAHQLVMISAAHLGLLHVPFVEA